MLLTAWSLQKWHETGEELHLPYLGCYVLCKSKDEDSWHTVEAADNYIGVDDKQPVPFLYFLERLKERFDKIPWAAP